MMKKSNNKGFTLAELLIVIAIIAILIAIAIPAFSSSLYAARLQTDHGNIRSAYAMFQTAKMLNTIEVDGVPSDPDETTYYFMKDGTLSETATPGKVYECMVKPKDTTDCAASVGCNTNTTLGIATAADGHDEGAKITITYTAAAGGNPAKWEFKVAK